MTDHKTYIYGGTFDPPHQGHLNVIKSLLAKGYKVVIAATTQNPLKQTQATPLAIRLEMLEAALSAAGIAHTKDRSTLSSAEVLITDFAYNYVCDFVDWWKENDTNQLVWVVASDIADQVETWKRWKELGVEKYVAQITEDISASDIRQGAVAALPAVAAVIEKYNLYQIKKK